MKQSRCFLFVPRTHFHHATKRRSIRLLRELGGKTRRFERNVEAGPKQQIRGMLAGVVGKGK